MRRQQLLVVLIALVVLALTALPTPANAVRPDDGTWYVEVCDSQKIKSFGS